VLLLCLVMLMPLYWLIATSLTEGGQEFSFPPRLVPSRLVFENYFYAMTRFPFHLYFANSATIALLGTLGCLLTESLVAYGFGRLRFPGRDFLFMLCLGTMMLPFVVTMIPVFVIFKNLGLVDTVWPLIIPYWFGGSPFGIFLVRQYYTTVPYELEEAARIDGASYLRSWWSILLPQSVPVLMALGILHFVWFWNDFMGPLIYLHSETTKTLSLGILNYRGMYVIDWNYLMAAALVMMLPVMIIFVLGQRFFTRSIVIAGFGGR